MREPTHALIHEDDDMLVVDKAAGVAAAPTKDRDRGSLLQELDAQGRSSTPLHVVHRLDVGTSGLMVFAKHKTSAASLSEMFQAHRLTREYLAIVSGQLLANDRLLSAPVAGRPARSRLTTLEHLGELATLLKAVLETGRTHQLRIHMASIGHPILGDRRYGRPTRWHPKRLALHAARLAFSHPMHGEPLDFHSGLPHALQLWMEKVAALSGKDTL